MGKDKKLFKSEDFDKNKKLFTSEDFDKQTESNDKTTGKNVKTQVEDSPTATVTQHIEGKWNKITASIVAVAAVVVGCILFIPNLNTEISENKQIAEVTKGTQTETIINKNSISENKATSTSDVQNDVALDNVKTMPSGVKNTNSMASSATETVTPQIVNVDAKIEGSTETLANEVIAGKFANWPERERRLGRRYKEVQSKVNEMYRNGLVK